MGTKKSKLIPALDEQDRFVLLKIKREFSKDESVSAHKKSRQNTPARNWSKTLLAVRAAGLMKNLKLTDAIDVVKITMILQVRVVVMNVYIKCEPYTQAETDSLIYH
jgi:hypothetical protein